MSDEKTRCWFAGPLRIRWAGRDFKPLYSERYGHRRWYGIGRLKVRVDLSAQSIGLEPNEDFIAPTMALDSIEPEPVMRQLAELFTGEGAAERIAKAFGQYDDLEWKRLDPRDREWLLAKAQHVVDLAATLLGHDGTIRAEVEAL